MRLDAIGSSRGVQPVAVRHGARLTAKGQRPLPACASLGPANALPRQDAAWHVLAVTTCLTLQHVISLRVGAGDGNRTHASSLGSYSSTIELHPRDGFQSIRPRQCWQCPRMGQWRGAAFAAVRGVAGLAAATSNAWLALPEARRRRRGTCAAALARVQLPKKLLVISTNTPMLRPAFCARVVLTPTLQ